MLKSDHRRSKVTDSKNVSARARDCIPNEGKRPLIYSDERGIHVSRVPTFTAGISKML